MADNMTVLDRNVLAGLDGCPYAEAAYFRAKEVASEGDPYFYVAEAYAQTVKRFVAFLNSAIEAASRPYAGMTPERRHDLMMFVMKRQWHSKFGEVSPPMWATNG